MKFSFITTENGFLINLNMELPETKSAPNCDVRSISILFENGCEMNIGKQAERLMIGQCVWAFGWDLEEWAKSS
jgi:hypothetical protein